MSEGEEAMDVEVFERTIQCNRGMHSRCRELECGCDCHESHYREIDL